MPPLPGFVQPRSKDKHNASDHAQHQFHGTNRRVAVSLLSGVHGPYSSCVHDPNIQQTSQVIMITQFMCTRSMQRILSPRRRSRNGGGLFFFAQRMNPAAGAANDIETKLKLDIALPSTYQQDKREAAVVPKTPRLVCLQRCLWKVMRIRILELCTI